MPENPERSRATVRRAATRYVPFVAVVAAIAIVVAIAGTGGGGGEPPRARAPRRAAAHLRRGQRPGRCTVNWGPNCDTSTGRVAVPFSYAPPCVPAVPRRQRRRDRARRHRRHDHRRLYQQQPDMLQQTFFSRQDSDASLAAEARTTQAYVDFFKSHYETYGRKVQLVPLRASGSPDDDVAGEGRRHHASRRSSTPSRRSAGRARRRRTPRSSRPVASSASGTASSPCRAGSCSERAPYVWPTLAAPEQAAVPGRRSCTSQLAGRDAIYAGDPKLRRQIRRFGVVRFDDGTGIFDATYKPVRVGARQARAPRSPST